MKNLNLNFGTKTLIAIIFILLSACCDKPGSVEECDCYFYPDTTKVFDSENNFIEEFKGDPDELYNKCEYNVDSLAVGRKIGSRMFVTAYSTICFD